MQSSTSLSAVRPQLFRSSSRVAPAPGPPDPSSTPTPATPAHETWPASPTLTRSPGGTPSRSDSSEMAEGMGSPRCSQWPSHVNGLLVVLLVLQLCVAGVLFVRASHEQEEREVRHLDAFFKGTHTQYSSTMQAGLVRAVERLVQLSSFISHVDSMEEFLAFATANGMASDRLSVLRWSPAVKDEDRADWERETYAELVTFFNSTEVPRNISVFFPPQDMKPAPTRPLYLPALYMYPPMASHFYMRDPTMGLMDDRAGGIQNRSFYEQRQLISQRYYLGMPPNERTMSLVSLPVYDSNDKSEPIGIVTLNVDWNTMVTGILDEELSANVIVGLHDITADRPDLLGCLYPKLMGAERVVSPDPSVADSWNLEPVHSVLETCAPDVESLRRSTELYTEISLLDRKLLMSLDRGDDLFALNGPKETTAAFVAVGAVLLSIAIVQMVLIVGRGCWLIKQLYASRKAMAEQLERTRRAETRACREAELRGQFMAHLNHELRSPLFGITGVVAEIRESVPSASASELRDLMHKCDSLELCARDIESSLDTVVNLQNLTQGHIVLRPEELSITSLLEAVCIRFDATCREQQVVLSFDVSADIPDALYGDPSRLLELLSHLVENAIEHSPQGAAVHVGVCLEDDAQQLHPRRFSAAFNLFNEEPMPGTLPLSESASDMDAITSDAFDSHGSPQSASPVPSEVPASQQPQSQPKRVRVRFMVNDSGTGIAADRLETIFQPYAKDRIVRDKKHQLLGFGLPIVRQLAQLMGGYTGVESEVDQGSSFIAVVVLHDAPPVPSQDMAPMRSRSRHDLPHHLRRRAPSSQNSQVGSPRSPYSGTAVQRSRVRSFAGRILVVDDSAINRYVLVSFLERLLPHASIDEAEDGQIAIERVLGAQHAGMQRYSLIFMDVQMPRLNGMETTIKLRELGLVTPIIAVTGGSLAQEREQYLSSGMTGIVAKPCTRRELHDVLLEHYEQLCPAGRTRLHRE